MLKLAWQITCVLMAILGGYFARQTPLSVLVAVSTAMVALAGVVVTVFGIWVAIIFPKLVDGLESGSAPNSLPQKERYRSLISSLYRSCFILCVSTFVFLVSSLYGNETEFFRASVANFVWLAFFSIVSSLSAAVISGESAVASGINDSLRVGLIRRLRRAGKHVKKG